MFFPTVCLQAVIITQTHCLIRHWTCNNVKIICICKSKINFGLLLPTVATLKSTLKALLLGHNNFITSVVIIQSTNLILLFDLLFWNEGERILTILGTHFGEEPNGSSVFIGEAECELLQWINDSISCLLPTLPPAVYSVNVRVANQGYPLTRSILFTTIPH